MREPISRLKMEHYQNFGSQMYSLIENSDSLVMIRVKKKKNLYHKRNFF